MKKWYYWIFTTVILLLGLCLVAGMLLFGPSKAGANEQLSKAPEFLKADGSWNPDFLKDAAGWVSDHFFLRQELISIDNWISANVFKTSGAESVILGKEGWLYFADTLPDYSYTEHMTAREYFCAFHNLSLMAEYAKSQGKEFLFVAVPNKNLLYPQYMPEDILRKENSAWMEMTSQLDHRKIPYVDLYRVFRQEDEELYFAHDSHWNSKGAALGADAILKGFGVESRYFADAFSQTKPHTGDLYEMLYPAFADPESDVLYGGTLDFSYVGNAKKPDSITLETAGKGQGRLLAYRDSFGNLLYPYLADSYASARFSRSVSYDLTLEADHILIELVQRNLGYLQKYLPVLESPERELTAPAQADGTLEVSVTPVDAPAEFVRIEGTVDAEIAYDSRICVVCSDGIYEALLLENGGFGVYVPQDQKPVGVLYSVGDDWKMLNVQ